MRSYAYTAVALALAAMVLTFSNAAMAATKSSGDAIGSRWTEAWGGYGENGYAARPLKKRTARAAKVKSKQIKAYASSYDGQSVTKKKSKYKKYAAIDRKTMTDVSPPSKSLTGGVRWAASSGCLNGSLLSVVHTVASSYGAVTVSSTCRGRKHNASVGGAKRSHHLSGDAVDFRVHGNWRGALAYLRGRSGGFHHYGGGLFHVDSGPTRRW